MAVGDEEEVVARKLWNGLCVESFVLLPCNSTRSALAYWGYLCWWIRTHDTVQSSRRATWAYAVCGWLCPTYAIAVTVYGLYSYAPTVCKKCNGAVRKLRHPSGSRCSEAISCSQSHANINNNGIFVLRWVGFYAVFDKVRYITGLAHISVASLQMRIKANDIYKQMFVHLMSHRSEQPIV